MATHHMHQRRQHSSLRKRRLPTGPPVADKLQGSLKLDKVQEERRGTSERQKAAAVLERRQDRFPTRFFPLPTTDLFPPEIPGRGPVLSTSVVDEDTTTSQFIRSTPTFATESPAVSSPPVIPQTAIVTPTLRTSFIAPSVSTSSTPIVAAPLSTAEPQVSVITITSYVRAATAGNAASTAPPVADLSGAISAGPVVGGIIAGLVGIAAIAALVAFFVRRAKRKRDETSFNASDFRRSAMLMPEPPRAFNSPTNPPEMSERSLPQAPASYIPQFVVPPHNDRSYATPSTGHDHNGAYSDDYSLHSAGYYPSNGLLGNTMTSQSSPTKVAPSFSPDQIVDFSTMSANPFMNPAPYSQSPFSPDVSPVSPQDPFDPSGESTTVLAQIGGAPVLTRAASTLSRGASTKSTRSTASGKAGKLSISVPSKSSIASNTTVYGNVPVPVPSLSRQSSGASTQSKRSVPGDLAPPPPPPVPAYSDDSGDYVDLARASVSPYQAAQYAEISKKLRVDIPKGMPSPMVDQYLDASRDRDLPPLPPPSPMVNSTPPPPPPAPLAVVPKSRAQSPFQAGNRASEESDRSLIVPPNIDLEFPIPPPSPAFTTSSRHRIPSTPPLLPEIHVQSRVSVGSYTTDESFNAKLAQHAFGLEHPNGSNGSLSSHSHGHGLYTGGRTEVAFPSGVTAGASPFLGRFPVTPSPLATSFSVETPGGLNLREKRFSAQQERSLASVVAEQNMLKSQAEEAPERTPSMRAAIVAGKQKAPPPPLTDQEKRSTTYSLYDPDDAYGGI